MRSPAFFFDNPEAFGPLSDTLDLGIFVVRQDDEVGCHSADRLVPELRRYDAKLPVPEARWPPWFTTSLE